MSVRTGPVESSSLGRTLTHEHLYLDYHDYYRAPPSELLEYLEGDITIQNVGFVQRYPYSNKVNIDFSDKEAVLYDVKLFKKHGGGTIVENTTHGLNRNVPELKKLSKETAVKIVAGSGFYLADSQGPDALKLSSEDIYNVMKQEMTVGCSEDESALCGFLGEVASNYPTPSAVDGFELRSIKATGQLQGELKCPVSFHPARLPESPFEIMRKYAEAGGDPKKAIMSHIDRTLLTESLILQFADEFKSYVQFDLFGTEVLVYQFAPDVQMPSDRQRIDRIRCLIDHGFADRVLMSHDIHTRQRLLRYGGHGYMHIFSNILPKMKHLGVSQDDLDQITITNPSQWLTW